MGTRIRTLFVIAAAAAALAAAGCGSDDETSATTSAETTTTTAETSTTTSETTEADTGTDAQGAGPAFEEASSALEDDGFDLDDKTGAELEQRAGLPEPITAVAGTDATRSGSSGDVLIFEFADEADAKAYAKVNNDDLLTTEVVGTLTLTSVTSNTDLLDQALAAIGG
ncbi:MAG: hypothetical protein U0R51_01460 [Solirubrobacterales bacterium]